MEKGWIASSGDDRIDGGSGSDLLVGGDGTDTVVYSGALPSYKFLLTKRWGDQACRYGHGSQGYAAGL
ncbi:MAG: hypothetical protein IPH35_25040 [Rhodoferax sp.]|nr:hypothetical protein [Rhodoferax sp.]